MKKFIYFLLASLSILALVNAKEKKIQDLDKKPIKNVIQKKEIKEIIKKITDDDKKIKDIAPADVNWHD